MSNALLFHESFDTFATAQLLSEGWTGTGINSSGGRHGSGALTGFGNSTRTLAANYQTLLLTCAFLAPAFINSGTVLCGFSDAGTSQFDVRANDASGGLKLTRNGTLVGSPTVTGLFTPGAWHVLEFRVTFGTSTAGTAELKLDNTSVLLASGVNTSNTTNAFANGLLLINSTGGFIDDLYLYGGNGGSVPSYLGDLAVKAFAPTADGFHLDGTPNSGTAHWSRTSEIPPDDDTSYNSLSSVGAIDGATFATVGAGTVYGVQHRFRARYDDAGPHTIASVVRISGVDYTSSAVAVSNTYQTYAFMWEVSPATSVAWTVSEINGAEFDTKLVT